MTQSIDERALDVAARALFVQSFVSDTAKPYFLWENIQGRLKHNILEKARAAVAAYLESAPPEIRIGDFIIRHAGDRVWIGRSGGEGGEFATANVEAALAQFYHANF
jgi:hypothetical protein